MITKKTIGQNEFMFVNTSGDRRGGFYHQTTLYMNDYELCVERCNYINRTWESYTFQSVMKNAVYSMIKKEENDIVSEYKHTTGTKRLSKLDKDVLFIESDKIRMYKELLIKL